MASAPPAAAASAAAKQRKESAAARASAAQEKLRARRNYVLAKLVGAYGRAGAARFCRAFLHPSRWQALRRVCFREEAAR